MVSMDKDQWPMEMWQLIVSNQTAVASVPGLNLHLTQCEKQGMHRLAWYRISGYFLLLFYLLQIIMGEKYIFILFTDS